MLASRSVGATIMICLTTTGATARLVAKHRPNVPVVCFTATQKVGRQLQLCRGLHPVVALGELSPEERPEVMEWNGMEWNGIMEWNNGME